MTDNRETWLENAVTALSTLFTDHGYDVPVARVSVGWPSRGGLSLKKRVLGECWKPGVSADGISQVYISPMMIDPVQVLATLLHELVHVWDKGEHGHRGPFVAACKDFGLKGPWTATTAGEDLAMMLVDILVTLGEYPHSQLTPSLQKKVSKTYMRKVECEETGYVLRTTKKWLDLYGPPVCPCCGDTMKSEEEEETEDE